MVVLTNQFLQCGDTRTGHNGIPVPRTLEKVGYRHSRS